MPLPNIVYIQCVYCAHIHIFFLIIVFIIKKLLIFINIIIIIITIIIIMTIKIITKFIYISANKKRNA